MATFPERASDSDRAARLNVYETGRPDVVRRVPIDARRILDLGCSSGLVGAAIKARQAAYVMGVELDPVYAELARTRLDEVIVDDVESFVRRPAASAPFDCLVCADVLEHLVDPWSALSAAVGMLDRGATVVVSLPNVLHFRSLARVLRRRRWPRDDWGVFDRTHLRWFALEDARDLLAGAGVHVDRVDLRVWNRSELTQQRLSRLATTPLGPFIGQQHVLVGRRS